MEIGKLDTLKAQLEYWKETMSLIMEWDDVIKYNDYLIVKNKLKELEKELKEVLKNDKKLRRK